MAIEILDDETRKSGGYALLRVPGRADAATRDLSVKIRRFRQGDTCLGPSGWQPGEYAFKPEEKRAERENLVLVLGPTIVDVIEEYDSVELSIPELSITQALRWPPLTPSLEMPADQRSDSSDTAQIESDRISELLERRNREREANAVTEALSEQTEARHDDRVEPPPITPGTEQPSPVQHDRYDEHDAKDDEREREGDSQRSQGWHWGLTGALLGLILVLAVGAFLYHEGYLRDLLDGEEPVGPGKETEATLSPEVRHEQAVKALTAEDFDTAIQLLKENHRLSYGPSILSLAEYYADQLLPEAMLIIADACRQGFDGAGSTYESILAKFSSRAAEGNQMARIALETDGEVAAEACG